MWVALSSYYQPDFNDSVSVHVADTPEEAFYTLVQANYEEWLKRYGDRNPYDYAFTKMFPNVQHYYFLGESNGEMKMIHPRYVGGDPSDPMNWEYDYAR
jgi:hypothetical protein